jgi:hypothetical protein
MSFDRVSLLNERPLFIDDNPNSNPVLRRSRLNRQTQHPRYALFGAMYQVYER